MASRSAPRSAADATRFTPTTPHASAKTPAPSPSPSSPSAAAGTGRSSAPGGAPRGGPETPEQRVRRLRAAHLAAQRAHTTGLDRLIGGSRSFLDTLHQFTIRGVIVFTVLAGVATIYSVIDMARYNAKRKLEFHEAMARYSENDRLATARIAFLNGSATPEQASLVEEATKLAKEAGRKLPPLLPPTATAGGTDPNAAVKTPILKAELPRPQRAAVAADATGTDTDTAAKPKLSWKEWFFSSLKREEQGDDKPSNARLGWDSLSEEDDGAGIRESDLVRAVEDKAEYLKTKARAAFETERLNQRRGGSLDQVGLEDKEGKSTPAEKPKKGWW